MKKILYTFLLTVALGAMNLIAQSNPITWTFNHKAEKGFFKTEKNFDSTFSGFKNKEEATKFAEQFKTAPDVASYVVSNVNNNKFDVKFAMKNTHNKMFYVGMASKMGVTYMSAMGQTRTLAEMQNKNK
jgi:fructoselysine-6-P-deglycase FrlB-like protein